MLTVAVSVLSFVASTLAYSISFPSTTQGWTSTGPQNVNWTMVDTDPSNFTILLTNQQLSGFQSEILEALVVGSTLSTIVNAPSGGWPPGSDYRVDFVKDPQDLDTILAQSGNFNITSSSTTSSSSGTSGVTVIVPTASATLAGGSTGTSDSSASDSASILPTSSTGAALSYSVQTGLLGLFSLLGFAFA